MLKWFAVLVPLVGIAAAYTFWFVCPCATVPGGALSGEIAPKPVADWSFVNDVGLCQVEVDRGLPWSINLNCMSAQGELFISCSQCAGKGWSAAALDNPQGYIRVRDTVYPVTLTRVIDTARLDQAWRARTDKLDLGEDTPRPAHWWSFQLQSRN